MKYDSYSSLFEIQNILSQDSFNEEDINDRAKVLYLFVLFRKTFDCLITKDKFTKFGLLNFYCTWTIHIDMDRNKECKLKVKELSQLITTNKDNPDLSQVLSKALSITNLFQQINDLILTFEMFTGEILSENKWKQIEPILIKLISTAPLKDNSGTEYIKEISIGSLIGPQVGLPLGKTVYGFQIITKDLPQGIFLTVPIVDKFNNYYYIP
jgi:hypothetical protein